MAQENENHCSCLQRMNISPVHVDRVCVFFGELIATALLMFLGCMGCIDTGVFPNTHFQMALNFGFVVLIAIQCFGCVSGAHINPAVTLAALIYRLISLPMALVYFVAQFLGAFIGYGLLKALMPSDTIRGANNPNGLCITALGDTLTPLQGVFIEFAITCILITFCCGAWDPRNARFEDSTPLRFGLAVSCLSLTAGRFTGASMNPARSFAPAVWNNSYQDHWIYWVGPLAAAVFTSLIYKYVFRREVVKKSTDKLRDLEQATIS